MAAVTHRVTTPDTGNLPNTSGAFTPAVGDLLVVFVTIEASTADHTLSSSVGGFTFTQIGKELFRTSASALLAYVSDALVSSATSQTVSIPSPGSGSIISVYSISGLTRTGSSAVRQQGGQSNQTAATTPAPAFAGAALTGNLCIGAVANATNPAGLTQPGSWTESQDTGYTTGAVHGLETAFRNSGETNTTITWGSTSASIFASIILELDITALITGTISSNLPIVTASMSGIAEHLGTINTNLPKVTAAMSGISEHLGTLGSILPIITAALVGQKVDTGTLNSSLLIPTSNMSGNVSSGPVEHTGTIDTNLLIPTAAFVGQKVETGIINSNLLIPTANFSGIAEHIGTLTSTLPKPTSAMSGGLGHSGIIDSNLPMITANFAGSLGHPGTIAANLPIPLSSMIGFVGIPPAGGGDAAVNIGGGITIGGSNISLGDVL